MKKLKFLLFIVGITIVTVCIIFLSLAWQFGSLFPEAGLRIHTDTEIRNLTLVLPLYSINDEILIPGRVNASIVDTKYGEMLKLKIDKVDGTKYIAFKGLYREPLDLFSIDLKPKFNETVINISERGRYYDRTSEIVIPVYVEYEGNKTDVSISYVISSGQDCLFGIIPISPKYNGKVYAGDRFDEFKVNFTGWGEVIAKSRIIIVYASS